MQKSTLISMMEEKSVLGRSNLTQIDKLLENHPYCATFQILKAIGLKESDDIDFKAQLNIAAIYTGDRSKLYDYVVREKLLTSVKSSEAESAPVNEKAVEVPEEVEISIPVGSLQDQSVTASDNTENESTPPESLLSSEPLEEQIMREAMMHIGEMETSYNLEKLAREEQEKTPATEPEKSAPSSFGSWLLELDKKRQQTEQIKPETTLIEKFIQESPQISPVKAAFFSPSQMGKLSLMEDESFVSETLAKIYERQGDFKKASRAYKNLGLKYPEKSIYFAALQKKAEDNLKNK